MLFRSLLLGAITKFLVSYALIGRGDVGIIGAPIGTVVSYAISLCVSVFALELSGVKTHAIFKNVVILSGGIISFYLPYKSIYSIGVGSNSFVSMAISLFASGMLYIMYVVLLYVLSNGKTMFKLHKKRHNTL